MQTRERTVMDHLVPDRGGGGGGGGGVSVFKHFVGGDGRVLGIWV